MKNEFLKGGVILTLSSFVVNVFNYFFNFLVGRSLGPSGYGEIATLFSYITLLSIPTAILGTIIIQKIGTSSEKKLFYTYSIEKYINGKIIKYIPLLLLSFILIPFIPRITNLSFLTSLVLIPLILLTVLSSIYNSYFQGLKLFLLIAGISLVTAFLKMSGGVAVALHLGQLEVVLFFLIVSSLVSYLLSVYSFKKETRRIVHDTFPKKRILHYLLSPQFIVTGISVAAMLALNNIDIIYVKKFFTAQEAGLYSSWSLFAKAIFYILGPLLGVSFIFFAHNKNQKDQRKSFLLSLLGLIILGVLSFFFYTFFAQLIISLLFGKKFISITPYLGLASIFGSLYAIITFVSNYFIAKSSKWSLVLAYSLLFYILGLFFIVKSIVTLFYMNIIYCTVVVVIYLIAFFLEKVSYNIQNGK
jgi:O-antigen/teichoic acid export membrane protein